MWNWDIRYYISFLYSFILEFFHCRVWDTKTCSRYLNGRSIWKEWEQFVLSVWNFCSIVFLNKVFYIYSKIVFHLHQSLWCSSDVSKPNLWLALKLWWSVRTLKEKGPIAGRSKHNKSGNHDTCWQGWLVTSWNNVFTAVRVRAWTVESTTYL